ncbi:MAG: sulfatase [bacterium]|nr:sulfatase [bacterium]
MPRLVPLLMVLAACADESASPGRNFARVQPVAGHATAAREPALHLAHDPSEAWSEWLAQGELLPGAPAGTARIGGAGARRLVVPGPLDLTRFNTVAIDVDAPSSDLLRLVLARGDERVPVPPSVRIGEGGAARCVFDFSWLPREGEPWDELWILFSGEAEHADVRAIELMKRPLRAFLPDPSQPPALVTIERDTRTAFSVFSDAPRRISLRATDAATLEFAVGLPDSAREAGVELELVVRAPGIADWRCAIPPGEAWAHQRIAMDGVDGTVLATFELVAQNATEVTGCAVTVPEVVTPIADPPTVLLITSDTHRADYLGCARAGVEVATPAIDALAERGVRFTDCVAESSVTNPSHVAIFTATHPRDTGVVDNASPLGIDAPTLAEAFHAAGWTTVAVTSASHLAPARSGLGQGFDRFAAPRINEGETFDSIASLQRWLPELEDRPLFAWVHVFDAHAPYAPPTGWADGYYTGDPRNPEHEPPRRVPPWARGVRDLGYLEALYRGEVSWLDERLRAVLDVPRFARGHVALTADHGEHLGVDDGRFDHRWLMPEVLRVPLMLAGPEVPVGVRSGRRVTNTDLGRTLLDLAGLTENDFPGQSLLARLEDGTRDTDPRFALSMNADTASIEVDGWFLILYLRSVYGVPRHAVQLFRIADDPGCDHDLAADELERARELREALVRFLVAARPEGWNVSGAETTEEERIELSALGYTPGGKSDSRNAWIDPDCDCSYCTRD